MKTLMSAIFAAAILWGVSPAQDMAPSTNGATPQTQQNSAPPQSASPTSTQASNSLRIAPGSVIPVQLTKSIDAKKVKTGDEIEATVTQDLKAGNGEIVVPKDTKVMGRVTEAQPRSKEQKESQVGITFDRAVMKTGGDVALPMSIQAIISPSYLSGGNNGGGQSASQASTAPNSGMPQGGGRSGMGTGTQQPSATASQAPSGEQGSNTPHEPITGNTQGVLGIPNLTLSTSASTAQGSVVSSEKNNVKIESGTLMLLRVNQ